MIDKLCLTGGWGRNEAPVAKAKDLTIILLASVVFLDGSESSDDEGIIRWLWITHDDIPVYPGRYGRNFTTKKWKSDSCRSVEDSRDFTFRDDYDDRI